MQLGFRRLGHSVVTGIPSGSKQKPATRTLFTATMSSKPARRSFAPLGASQSNDSGAGEQLKGVVFDMDGTLCMINHLPPLIAEMV